ncbi:MAG: cardiolipin synthase, partial [Paramuribaculum sp.]|nr:cardiolipin synthase [Paramuribaculum sp.]
LYWGLTIAYAVTIVSIIGVVLSENRNPVKSLAWVTVLLLFPAGGILLYVFFGRSIKNQRMISRRNRKLLTSKESTPGGVAPDLKAFNSEARQQIELCRALTGARLHIGNSVRHFCGGKEKFDSLLADIASAQRYIHVQYYIFEDDKIGTTVAAALMERARKGVKVRVIYDDVGCLGVKNKFFKAMKEAGIEVHPFFKVTFSLFATRINWRNHRKLCVIDGRIGYVGGMNVADRYIDGGKFHCWRDMHLRIEGPVVGALQYSFAVDWSFMGQPLVVEETVASKVKNGVSMQFVTSGPTSEWSNVALVMLKAIGNAKKRVWIQTPYFLPPESILRTLQAAAIARVDVRVMMPRHSDSTILTYASYSYVMECLRAGVKIYLFDAGMLHSKCMVIDDEFCAVGSTNIDFRSFEHNFEGMMFMYSKDLNSKLRSEFMADEARSTRLVAGVWRHRPYTQKALESMVRLLSPVL